MLKIIKTTVSLLLALMLICVIFTVSGYFFYVASLEPCSETWPIPRPAVIEFSSGFMETDQGPLYIGQTYHHQYEGPWVGNFTLLFLDRKGATFLIRYPEGAGSDFQALKCKSFIPRPTP